MIPHGRKCQSGESCFTLINALFMATDRLVDHDDCFLLIETCSWYYVSTDFGFFLVVTLFIVFCVHENDTSLLFSGLMNIENIGAFTKSIVVFLGI